MNWAHHLSEETFGPRHIQPHQPRNHATKKKKLIRDMTVDQRAYRDAQIAKSRRGAAVR